jgi:hypothetical protein
MDAVTYPDKAVVRFVEEHVIPLRVPFDEKPLADDFNVKWTPTLVILDPDGTEHHRTTGFQPPEEMPPMIMLGTGKTYFELGQFQEADRRLNELLSAYPSSNWAPEAIYFRAVARYKKTNEAGPLKEAYEILQMEYPNSEWTNRAAPYRLL